MTHSVYSERNCIQDQPLYLDRHGDLYQTPGSRAELLRHLHFQRRLVAHLADVIAYITRSRAVRP